VHSKLLRTTTVKDLAELFPERFSNKTNGVTPRRWLMQANPRLTKLICDAVGDKVLDNIDDLSELNKLANDAEFQRRFAEVKRANKADLARLINRDLGIQLNPSALFDVHVKRIHEYKRQLLNILATIATYESIRSHPEKTWVPRVKIFGGKAAASYWQAKLIIKLANDVAKVINNDPAVHDLLKVVFVPNYNVSLAETIIPAADLSEQISTAGMEASGTGNMKFALNGALTIGTLDGANVEIRDRVGADNIVIFGLTAEEVEACRRNGHDPRAIIEANADLREGTASAIGSPC
jgi:starch phosphorylase